MTTDLPPPVGPTIMVVWRVSMVSYICTTLSTCKHTQPLPNTKQTTLCPTHFPISNLFLSEKDKCGLHNPQLSFKILLTGTLNCEHPQFLLYSQIRPYNYFMQLFALKDWTFLFFFLSSNFCCCRCCFWSVYSAFSRKEKNR